MPLERVVVRNAHALGARELYKGRTNREDPTAVFDGVAVAGLVGILRQLGDLAEFAAEVFHGLQEEVVTTASRSRKLVNRVKQIESMLPKLEKAALSQTSHLHFCYTAGTDWHVHILNQRNHLIHGELPKFIMDSYEECREPPRLHLLDKFDADGPGSCLKKYSDPTFFKKATPLPDEALGKAEKDKRHHRRKKKRQGQKNREVHSLYISNGIARMQLVPPKLPDSPGHSHSLNEAALKSELVDPSELIDLRTGSDFIECVFDRSYSAKAEEEPKEPHFTLPPNEYFNSDFSEHNDDAEENDSHHKSSLLDEPSTSSTRVSWEEKMEIVNFKDYGCVPDEGPKTLIHDSCIDEATAANHCQADQIFSSDAIQTENATIVPDDFESDGEDFMDALNTIESESDIDSEYQAKQVVDHNTLALSFPEICQESSHGPSTFNSAHGLMSPSKVPSDCPDTVSLNGHMPAELPQLAERCNLNSSESFLNSSHSDAIHNDPSPSTVRNSQDLENSHFEKIMNSVHDSRESPSESSARSSVTFWTNGGLLGLQPSKPPDFTASSGSSGSSMVTRKDDTLINSAENGPNKSSYNDDTVTKSSPTNRCTQQNASGFSHQERDTAPQMSGLAYRLFSNSFQGKLPSIHDYRSLPASSPEHDCAEHQTLAQKSFLEKFPKRLLTGGFDINSPNSSPPLEHMKISFLPMGALEASNLKLKFQDEGNNQEVYGDMLPSFQLVPDPSVPPRENGSDSDDDTFCRSPPSGSDDCFDYNSESSSGRWGSSETPRTNGQEQYDNLRVMQSAESDSGYRDLDASFHEHSDVDKLTVQYKENADQQSLSPSNELPSLDVIKSSILQEPKRGVDLKESHPLLQFPNEPSPPAPPLPPSQWICPKLPSDTISIPQDTLSAGSGHEQGFMFTGFSSFQEQQNLLLAWQPNFLETPPTTNQHKEEETTMLPPTNKLLDQQKVFGKAKLNQAVNETDEKDGFLQQIRAQSFNLRRTSLISSTRSTSMPLAPITNAKVTAILEKANAIRQVVVSDDGEDDTWSE